ncbi:MAG: cytochrome c3 family protein [Bacteroidota bacterium]
MKRISLVLSLVLFVAVIAYSQPGLQPVGLTGTTQGTKSLMLKGPHDFSIDSGAVTAGHAVGASKKTCGYCHAVHIPSTGVAAPLWVRSIPTGGSYGVYQNANSLDITPGEVKGTANYSQFCMSCHDGSFMFTSAAYEGGKRPRQASGTSWPAWADTVVMPTAANMNNGEYAMSHTHPVNFTYSDAVTADPGGLFAAATATYVYLDNTGTSPKAIGRLFDGKMQCSSCHDPHLSSGIGLVGSTDYGKLCVACHKK